jgi:predicted enzyme related to lactoylglutathione lyase
MANPKPGAIVHVEYSSKNPEATRKFLEGVFGWKFKKEDASEMEYWSFRAKGGPGGGLMAPMDGGSPSTQTYVLVASVDAALKKVESGGGKVLMPKTEIPKVGWFAVYEIPGGVVQAVFQAKRGR